MNTVSTHKNGNNAPSSRGTDKRFAKFRREVSAEIGSELLCYSTEWCDALCHRIATGDLIEATMAWTNYRANGNSSRRAVHLYSHRGEDPEETPLRQKDAAREIAWLRAGHPREWLDAPLQNFDEEMAKRGIVPIDKSLISDAFTFNRVRGTIYRNTGQDICPIPAPKVADSTEFREKKGERSPEWQAFVERWNVAHSEEFQEEQVARSTIARINKVRLSAYREERRSAAPQTNGTPSLKDLKAINNNNRPEASPEPDSVVVVVSQGTEVETVYEALSQHGQTTRKASAGLIAACRRQRPDCQMEWILELMRGFRFGPNTTNHVGVIIKALPLKIVDYQPPPQSETENERKARDAAYVLAHPEEFEEDSVVWATEYIRHM